MITPNALTSLDLMRVLVDQGLLEMDPFARVSFYFEYVVLDFPLQIIFENFNGTFHLDRYQRVSSFQHL